MAGGLGLGLYAAWLGGWSPIVWSLLAAVLALLLAALLFRWALGVGGAVGILGADFLVGRLSAGGTTSWDTVLFAACLLLVAELAYWWLESSGGVPIPNAMLWRRLAVLAAGALAAVALGGTVLLAGALPVAGGWPAKAVALGAALGSLLLLATLARTSAGRP